MKLIKPLMIITLVVLTTLSCSKEELSSSRVEVLGEIQQLQGVTTYQYGTHTIGGYALRSSTINLDDYLNQTVKVIGYKIEGYPVDGGPEFLEVKEVQ